MRKARDYQQFALDEIKRHFLNGINDVMIVSPTGTGKCHGINTPILMFDGSIKMVQDVVVGDKLMGPDSKPRNVLSLARGREQMFDVVPHRGETFSCNESHILSLVATDTGKIENISIRDYINKSKTFKHRHKLYRSSIDFCKKSDPDVDPYLVGMYLANGHKDNTAMTDPDDVVFDYVKKYCLEKNIKITSSFSRGAYRMKFSSRFGSGKDIFNIKKSHVFKDKRIILQEELTASREFRLKLLAGLIDGDGHNTNNTCEFITKHDSLRDGVLFLARSLGFGATSRKKISTIKSKNFVGLYNRIFISGDLYKIPTLKTRKQFVKRKSDKNVLRAGFLLNKKNIDNYYGFEIDGDHLYLLGDFTVTHNTFIIETVMRQAAEKNRKTIFVVRGRNLVDQTFKIFTKNGIDCGVYMANHWANKPRALCQIASIDTIKSRGLDDKFAIALWDEAHLITSDSDKEVISKIGADYNIGFTATPWQAASLEHIAKDDGLIMPITTQQAIDRGFLSPAVYFGAQPPDMKGVRKSGDDWNQGDIEQRMSVLQGDIVSFWLSNGERRPTMFFGVNVKHSKDVCAAFNAAGVKAMHVDANVELNERARIIQLLESKEIEVICSVGTMTTGVDIPIVSCIILGRPTKSYNLIKQIVGRGNRVIYATGMPLDTDEQRVAAIAAGPKPNFYIFDHSNSVKDHGYFYEATPEITLEGVEKLDTGPAIKQCPIDYAYYTSVCPKCGHKDQVVESKRKDPEADLSLSIQRLAQADPDAARILEFIQGKKLIAKKMKYKRGWIYHQIKDAFGEEAADVLYPHHKKAMMYAKAKR